MVMFAGSGVRSIDGFAFHRESMTQALNSGLPCHQLPVRRSTEEPVLRHTQNNDATGFGWVEGFRNGFSVHDELLGCSWKGQNDLHVPWSNHNSDRSRDEKIHY
jgi:hypothetical protein